jgi:hypothetical protein
VQLHVARLWFLFLIRPLRLSDAHNATANTSGRGFSWAPRGDEEMTLKKNFVSTCRWGFGTLDTPPATEIKIFCIVSVAQEVRGLSNTAPTMDGDPYRVAGLLHCDSTERCALFFVRWGCDPGRQGRRRAHNGRPCLASRRVCGSAIVLR